MKKTGITVDLAEWPVVRARCRGRMGPRDVPLLLHELRDVVRRSETFAVLAEVERSFRLSGGDRALIARFFKEHERELVTYCRGLVTVSGSSLVRGAVTAIHWAFALGVPSRVLADHGAAEQWVRRQLA
jgi:hypothetical protein